jgi:putative DNA primase/helicase
MLDRALQYEEDRLCEAYEEDRLLDAALRAGLREPEGRKTISSGLSKGILEPRTAPVVRQAVEAKSPSHVAASLKAINADDFLKETFPEREMLLAPVLPKKGLVMLHAARGTGKTFMSMSMAYAVASGGVCGKWSAPQPARVLFIDGEMQASALKERLAGIASGNETELLSGDYLKLIANDMQEGPMPNLATKEGQDTLEPFLDGVDLVVIDNLSTLARHGRSNDEESWVPVQNWLLELRRRSISVLMIHHEGKSGTQRGTSCKEDILDTVIQLKRPQNYRQKEGARFEIHFTKARGIFGDDAQPFEAMLLSDNGKFTWTTRDIEDVELEQLKSLLAEGCSIRDAAEEMGKSKGAIQRLKKKMDNQSRISSR